jgi:iron(III) transport system substrate-binding protein
VQRTELMRRYLGSAVLALLVLCGIGGCTGSDQPSVVLYVSADEYVAREVIAAFQQETGIRVRFVGDTEAKKTTGLVERLMAEKDNPQADVFWSSEVFLTIDLADAQVLEPYTSPATEDWPYSFRCHENRWYGFAARGRVIVYATDRMTEDELPQTWMDLTRDYYQGRIVMADPRFGTTGGHLGAMKAFWDRAYQPGIYEAFIEGLAANDMRMLASGNAGVVRAVANGEADLGMTDTDDVWAAQAQGMKVDLIYPRHSPDEGEGTGTLLIPNTVGRVAGGPNPEHAAMLIDFLLSERVERILAESVSGNVPIRPDLAAQYEHLFVPDPLEIEFRRAAAVRVAAVEQAMNQLR